jgi:intracellular multiplication protein IcmL
MIMALDDIQEKYIPQNNEFYRDHYHHFLYGLMGLIVFMMLMVLLVLYQMSHRPLPVFDAKQKTGEHMMLTPYNEPNLLPDTILQWARKAATTAYTFDFVNYNKQISAARPYFTADGWQDYLHSVSGLIENVVKSQLFVNGVVSGTPVIANQGPLPGKGYVWRIQIPFLVSYQSANTVSKRNYYVVLTIMRVPTEVNPQGIGIDQFVMTG